MKSKKQEKKKKLDDKKVFQFLNQQLTAWQDFLKENKATRYHAIKMLVVFVAAVCYFVDKEGMPHFMRYFTENLKSALEAGFDIENKK